MISIIVPVYNTKKYLQRCIESIIHQIYTNWELILVDDGSYDGSEQICDDYYHLQIRNISINACTFTDTMILKTLFHNDTIIVYS